MKKIIYGVIASLVFLFIVSCGPESKSKKIEGTFSAIEMINAADFSRSASEDWGNNCGFIVHFSDGRAIQLRGVPDKQFTEGGFCKIYYHDKDWNNKFYYQELDSIVLAK
jgi:hypothetical protein